MCRAACAGFLLLALAAPLVGQTPQPFPGVRAGGPEPAPRRPPAQQQQQQRQPPPQAAAQSDATAPTSAVVGFPIYPGARFLASFDAGKMQRYYVFGSTTPYAEVVKYYQGILRDRGDEVFRDPPTHMFAQRFREETMAFPPGVTVKDYTAGGSGGYPNATPGVEPARFPTVIVIVPPPPAAK